ncbi:MAG: hypothetical protein NC191_03845 [Muribaculaceae bacterium]|nr:hypothetical protein [Muribaculaceae bacterium]
MIRKIILSILLLSFTISPTWAKRLYAEKVYQAQWCKARGGITEYKLNDKTRVDCLLPTMAVEFDFANKWAECIGQALYYGQKTKRTPACVLIMENGEKDYKYLRRLRYAVYNKKKIPEFRTYTMKPEQLLIPVNYTK